MASKSIQPQTLSTFCQNSCCLRTKIALSTFYKVKYSVWTEKFILVIEYLQLMSLALLPTYSFDESLRQNRLIFDIVVYILKLAHPSYLVADKNYDSTTSTILLMVILGTLFKLLFFASAIYASVANKELNWWLLTIWRWIYKLQTRILYFLFTSFWIKAMIETKENEFSLFGMCGFNMQFVGSLLLAIEFLLSLMLETQLGYFLPTQNFLSSKNNHLQMTTFLQKFIIQVVTLSIRSDSEAIAWIIPIAGILIDLQRFYEFFSKLPFYHTKALILQGSLISVVMSLNVANFVNNILKAANNQDASLNFVIITWILLALLSIKISHGALKLQILSLLQSKDSENTPETSLHKVAIIKELKKNVTTTSTSSPSYDMSFLVSNLNIEKIFGINLILVSTSLYEIPQETMKRIYFMYYQELLKKYSKNELIKLHTAHRSWKNSESYSKTIRLATEIHQSKWSMNYLSSALLFHEIEKSLEFNQKESPGNLDLSTYLKSRLLMDDIKNKMDEQLDLQLSVCNNMLHAACDIGQIHNSAQRISKLKILIQRKIDSMDPHECCISPYLLYAEYHFVANHSMTLFEKYYKMYTQGYLKAQKFFKESALCEENLYQSSNAFLLVSNDKADSGKILFCNNSLMSLCGRSNKSLYQNSNISSLFPSCLKPYYYSLFKQSEEFVNKVHQAYLHHKDGYLVKVDFCFNYHPYLAQGLCLNLVIRAVENMEFLLLTEDGDIEGASQELSKRFGLRDISGKTRSVKILSDELYHRITENDDKKMTLEEDDQEIELYLPHEEKKSLNFLYSVQVLDYGSIKMKLVTLKAIMDFEQVKQDSPRSGFRNLQNPPMTIGEKLLSSENFDCEELGGDNIQSAEFRQNFPCYTSPRHTQADAPLLPIITEKVVIDTMISDIDNQRKNVDSKGNLAEDGRMDHFYRASPKEKVEKHISSSSKKSVETVENKTFKAALHSKSYPKSFVSLCIVFYFVIIMTFVGQIIMKSVSDSTMKDLQIRKNLLKESEERSYKGALIQINGQGILLLLSGLIQSGGTYNSIVTAVGNLQIRLHDMKEANDKMLDDIYSLEKEIQEEMFVANVRIDGTYLDSYDPSSKEISLFQATGETENVVKTLAGLTDPSSTAGFHIFNFLRNNLCDDFLYESSRITRMFIETVAGQKGSFQKKTNLFLGLNPFFLAGIGVLLMVIIWNQYRIERRNMKAFIKIPSGGVLIMREKLKNFKKNFINEENFENLFFSHLEEKSENTRSSEYSKKNMTQTISYSTIRKRYLRYIAKVFLWISFLVAITLWDLIITQRDIEIIYNRQNQLQYANYISNRVIATHITFVELFITNNTLKVEHEYPFDGLKEKSETIKTIQSEISQKFLEVDGTYNSEVRDILFDNSLECKGFTPDFVLYCNNLVRVGQPVNLITAFAAYQNAIAVKLQDYIKVNKSNLLAVLAAAFWNTSPLPYAILIAEEAHRIANIMDESMTRKISEMQDLKLKIIVIFSIGLFVVSIIIWFFILKVIREAHNDFKKVLQIFPPNLVLSSYLLKKFLQKTSNGYF